MTKKATVESVSVQKIGSFGPLIAKFNHGALIEPTNIKSINLDVSNTNQFSEDERKLNFDLSLKTDKMIYSSEVSSVKSIKCTPSRKTYIAIRNKTTNKVRLIETNPIHLGPVVFARNSTNVFLNESVDALSTSKGMDRMALKKQLVNKFGQAKGQRFFQQADRMKVDEDAYIDKMALAAENVNLDSLNSEIVESNFELIPPINRKATLKEEVYNLKNMISLNEIEALEAIVKTFNEKYPTEAKLDAFFKENKISKLVESLYKQEKNGLGKASTLGIILYIQGALCFADLKDNYFRNGPIQSLPNYLPDFVRKNIYTQFVDDGKLTPMSRDKALCHAIVLALLSSDYRIEFKDLVSSVRVQVPK
uniref:Putative LOC101743619 [Bombyx mori] n=1 Tax=Lepeophtheirus salmonis TaxID=72036 RepID=A0A0K2TY95_LEPSM